MQPQSAQQPEVVSVEQFLKSLGESGLWPAEEVKALLLPPAQRQDSRLLAQDLVRKQKLTRYQAAMLCQGKSKGLVLGNYEVLDKLGQGGMGMVYKARHRRMERVVALKVLSPAITKNATAVQRFQREAKAAAKLNHPNIVAAYDADEAKGVHFLVMEYVEGSDLSVLVKKQGPLPVGQAAACIVQAAHGLAHAHDAGIVHRDIKPNNLLVEFRVLNAECRVEDKITSSIGNRHSTIGNVKVLDMGLARIDNTGNAPAQKPAELTESGSIMGTCDYMAPEQALNTKHADHRSDIYSLGCTLYYLLTGKSLYSGETVMEKLMAHQAEPIPRLREARSEVSAELEAVYLKMVAKKPEERYQSMREVIAELEPFALADSGSDDARTLVAKERSKLKAADSGTVLMPRRRRWGILVGIGLAVAALGIGLALLLPGKPEPASPNKEPVDTAKESPGKADDNWIKTVQALPAEKQLEEVSKKLKDRNPGFDGKLTHKIVGGAVTELVFPSDHVTDIFPVKALGRLQNLNCRGSWPRRGKLADLSPLQGMKLTHLNVFSTAVSDLTPLKGMPLDNLRIDHTHVADLTPLKDSPLTTLKCNFTRIADLSPLLGSRLKDLTCEFKGERDAKILRSLKTLETINGKPAAEFWKQNPQ